ncbi:hypothetical protein CDAR_4211 [Caerostris darwini]|uniref:Uncharacterized protein n=1 Tax=Caerostris darwini TaxID=1538125 RepID=A0AAV4N4L1_9ARAC|nr:hypothetical protein CDAR_4211 [Caerostris darwini]
MDMPAPVTWCISQDPLWVIADWPSTTILDPSTTERGISARKIFSLRHHPLPLFNFCNRKKENAPVKYEYSSARSTRRRRSNCHLAPRVPRIINTFCVNGNFRFYFQLPSDNP